MKIKTGFVDYNLLQEKMPGTNLKRINSWLNKGKDNSTHLLFSNQRATLYL